MKQKLRELIGAAPASESGFKKRMRIHQGWWRAFVLGEKEGPHPIQKNETVCNTIRNGDITNKNFLNNNIVKAVKLTLKESKETDPGIIQEDRLFNNLLSSQPLCFNFFGELKIDKDFALTVLKDFFPEITEVIDMVFEYAPKEKYTNDNSAFDVAIKVKKNETTGLIGLECKYTDTFSEKEYDKKEYRKVFQKSKIFNQNYDQYIQSKFNQLFRNQLIAEALLQNDKIDFVITGLFCHKDDKAIQTGKDFQKMLKHGDNSFRIITYQDFIEVVQRQNISWEKRELSMMLWARYCGEILSHEAYEQFKSA